MSILRIAVAQMCSGIDPHANAAFLGDAVESAARQGARFLFTPETSGLVDRDRNRASRHVVTQDEDMVLRHVRAAAARAGIWVHIGSLALRQDGAPPDAPWVNRAFVIDDQGHIRAHYDKIHLFDASLSSGDTSSGETWRESDSYRAGDRAVIVETPWGKLGLSICYDLRFPRLYEHLTSHGATVLAIPAAFTQRTGAAHWHTLLRARAIEGQAFVIAAGQWGAHEDGRRTYGHSLVVDPWGRVLLDMGEGVGVDCVDLDLALLDQIRRSLPVHDARRDMPVHIAGDEG